MQERSQKLVQKSTHKLRQKSASVHAGTADESDHTSAKQSNRSASGGGAPQAARHRRYTDSGCSKLQKSAKLQPREIATRGFAGEPSLGRVFVFLFLSLFHPRAQLFVLISTLLCFLSHLHPPS
jgi:hypothetical protein